MKSKINESDKINEDSDAHIYRPPIQNFPSLRQPQLCNLFFLFITIIILLEFHFYEFWNHEEGKKS